MPAAPANPSLKMTLPARVGLPAISWILPFQSAAIAVLFTLAGTSAGTLRTIAGWKEILVVALFALVTVRMYAGLGPRTKIVAGDWLVTALISLPIIYALAQTILLPTGVPLNATLWGLRDGAFFFLLYFVGRATPEIADNPKTLKRLFVVGVLTSLVGIVEQLVVTPEMLVAMGASGYFQEFLDVSVLTQDNEYGLPTSYFTMIGGNEVQRAGSVYLSGQGFALPFLIIIPAATFWLIRFSKRSFWAYFGYAIIWLGLLATITRATIIACFLQMLVLTMLLNRKSWTWASVAAGVGTVTLAAIIVPGIASFLWQTIMWETGSSESHLKDWASGIDALSDRPWGSGVGTADLSAIRAGLQPLTTDSLYLKYAVEMGIHGMMLMLAVLAVFAYYAYQVFRKGTTPGRSALGGVVVLSIVGILFNGITAVVFNSLILAYLFAWFAGAVATIWARTRDNYE